MDENFIGNRISHFRIKKGVSARDMSVSLGQGVNYINTIENHKSFPSIQMLFYICEYFNISLKEFFDVDNNNPYLNNQILLDLKSLNDEQLEVIYKLMKIFKNQNYLPTNR